MNKEKYLKVLWGIVVVTALAEAVCGKKYMKRIGNRLKVLDREAVIEVWVGVHNLIRPDKSISTGNSAFAHSPIVKAESQLIVDKITSRFNPKLPNLDARLKDIIKRKSKNIYNELKEH